MQTLRSPGKLRFASTAFVALVAGCGGAGDEPMGSDQATSERGDSTSSDAGTADRVQTAMGNDASTVTGAEGPDGSTAGSGAGSGSAGAGGSAGPGDEDERGGSAAGDGGTVGDDGGTVMDPAPDNPAACPASHAELLEDTEACPTGVACAYPEGYCECVGHCSGAQPDPEAPPVVPSWSCHMPPEGCPQGLPTADDPCDEEGRSCWYGQCCFQRATCTEGRWALGRLTCPP